MPLWAFFDGVPALAVSFQTVRAFNTTTTVFTWPSLAIGAEGEGKRIFVGVNARNLTATSISSLVVGGVTATLQGSILKEAVTGAFCALYQVNLPTGTTATAVMTMLTHSSIGAAIAVYSVTNVVRDLTVGIATSTSSTPFAALTIVHGGVGIGVVNNISNAPRTAAWGSFVEDSELSYNVSTAQLITSASYSSALGTSVTATCTPSASAGASGVFANISP